MSKLLDTFEQNSLPCDLLKGVYGISTDEHFDCIFVAPSWTFDRVFGTTQIDAEQIFADRFAKTHRIRHNGKNYLLITLQVGAPNIMDFCLACYKANCDNFVFIGSVGALVPEIHVGDIIIPEYAISGNGATLYLHDRLDAKNMFEHAKSTPKLDKHIVDIATGQGINTLNVPVISMDSVTAEYIHLDEFRAMGAKALEMEVATFFACMNHIGKNASAILVVSDNSATGDHLVGRTDAEKVDYHAARAKVAKILLDI